MAAKAAAAYHGRDIVDRLRTTAPYTEDGPTMLDAADEIERLRPRVITDRKEFWDLPVRTVFLTRWEDGAVLHPIHIGDIAFAEAVLPVTVLWQP